MGRALPPLRRCVALIAPIYVLCIVGEVYLIGDRNSKELGDGIGIFSRFFLFSHRPSQYFISNVSRYVFFCICYVFFLPSFLFLMQTGVLALQLLLVMETLVRCLYEGAQKEHKQGEHVPPTHRFSSIDCNNTTIRLRLSGFPRFPLFLSGSSRTAVVLALRSREKLLLLLRKRLAREPLAERVQMQLHFDHQWKA